MIEMEMPAGGCEEWEMVKTEEEDNIWQDCHCVMYINLYIKYWVSKRTVWFRLNMFRTGQVDSCSSDDYIGATMNGEQNQPV